MAIDSAAGKSTATHHWQNEFLQLWWIWFCRNSWATLRLSIYSFTAFAQRFNGTFWATKLLHGWNLSFLTPCMILKFNHHLHSRTSLWISDQSDGAFTGSYGVVPGPVASFSTMYDNLYIHFSSLYLWISCHPPNGKSATTCFSASRRQSESMAYIPIATSSPVEGNKKKTTVPKTIIRSESAQKAIEKRRRNPPRYSCDLCDSSFTRKEGLKSKLVPFLFPFPC